MLIMKAQPTSERKMWVSFTHWE